MRLFAGIALPTEIQEKIARLLERVRPLAPLAWSPAANLHITTKFIGAWEDARLPELLATLGLVRFSPFEISIEGAGWYPDERRPRVLWLGVHGGRELAALAAATDAALATLGVAAEDRLYAPHLTLARVKTAAPLHALRDTLAGQTLHFGSFTVGRFHLYRSTPGTAGSVYSSLASFAVH